jgi:hypothetical protein
VFALSPCNAGPGTVKRADDPRNAGTERDKSNLLKATDLFYNNLSDSFVKGMVSVDFMIASTGAFMDASCFAPLSSRTGGLCRVFNQFNLATQVLQLMTNCLRCVQSLNPRVALHFVRCYTSPCLSTGWSMRRVAYAHKRRHQRHWLSR